MQKAAQTVKCTQILKKPYLERLCPRTDVIRERERERERKEREKGERATKKLIQ
jgi:hypothetical protein